MIGSEDELGRNHLHYQGPLIKGLDFPNLLEIIHNAVEEFSSAIAVLVFSAP